MFEKKEAVRRLEILANCIPLKDAAWILQLNEIGAARLMEVHYAGGREWVSLEDLKRVIEQKGR